MIGVMFLFHEFVKCKLKKTQAREGRFVSDGKEVSATVLSLKQIGLFLNYNPVVEMSLRIEAEIQKSSWLVENHKETIILITMDAWQVGNKYLAKTGSVGKKIVFVKGSNDRPLLCDDT